MREINWIPFLDVRLYRFWMCDCVLEEIVVLQLQIATLQTDPYTPIQLDARYDATTYTPLTTASGLPRNRVGEPNVLGMSALSENFTSSFFTGDLAKRALQRLQQQGDPWFLTASFHSPVRG